MISNEFVEVNSDSWFGQIMHIPHLPLLKQTAFAE
jgi:hypothetical protein